MKTSEYIAAIKQKHAVKSDYAVAKLIGVTPAKVCTWGAGSELPGTLNCMKIAEVLECNPIQVLADIEVERAEKAGREAQAQEWKTILERVGALVVSLFMGAVITGPTPSEASVHRGSDASVDAKYTS
jgi:DNA-binding transcriptional regulator YdaS (Cro superfamily)